MPTVAEQLRQAREQQNLTIYQVAEITKIRTDHIRALEEGNYDVFSAPVYIRGFVRSFSRVLKLDTEKVMADLDGELALTKNFREPPPLTAQPKGVLDFIMYQLSKVPWRTALPLLGGIGLVVLVVVAWKIRENREQKNPLQNLGPGLYQPTKPPPGEMLPLPKK